MKRFYCGCLVLLLALTVALTAFAESSSSDYSKGQKAEAKQAYEEAYKFYKEAYDKHPENTSYRSAFERLKFLAGAEHVHRGQGLREDGKLSEALKEFQEAAQINPSSGIAQQEIKRTQRLIEKAQQPSPPVSRANEGLSESAATIAGPVQLAPISQTPITLKLSENSRKVYESIGSLAGINVLFDNDYVPKPIHVELNGVSLEQALQVVALQSKTFYRPVTPNTIFVAQDTQQKRNELEQQALRTFYLNNFSTVNGLQDVANLIRTILRVERVQQFPSQNAIVMRGTPDQVALAELLINNLDKAKPEVVVDIVVMQVSKDKLKQLGIQNPLTSGTPSISFQNPNTASYTSDGSSSSGSGLTLNDLHSLTARDFAVTIPSSSVAFMMSDSDTHIIQRPQMRSIDGQKATLKIGQRVPIAVGTSSSTLTSTAFSQTQFQYQDVGVNIEMTPHIHGNGEVSLKLSVEVSAIDNTETLAGGLSEPIIGQRKVDHEMRMKDGEVNMVGGMMEHDDVRSMSGLPWISQVPILKYLFGQGKREKTDTETVFLLTPHIVRRLDVDESNMRSVDMGTQNVVEIHHTPRAAAPAATTNPAVPSAAPSVVAPRPATMRLVQPAAQPASQQNSPTDQSPPASNPVEAPAGTQAAPVPGASVADNVAVPTTAAPSPVLGPVLSINPPMVNQPAGAAFAINVALNGGQNIYSIPLEVKYDSKLLRFVSVSDAGALSRDGVAATLVHRDDAERGAVTISMVRAPGSAGIAPSGPLFTMMFVAKAAGQGTISIGKTNLVAPNNEASEASGSQAIVNVR